MENQNEENFQTPEQILTAPLPETSVAKTKQGFLKRLNKKTIKISVIIIAIAIFGFLIYNYKNLLIAATVDGAPISRLKVIRILEKVSGQQALDSLITQTLIKKEAEKKGIIITKDEVNLEINTIENQLKTQGDTLAQALTVQKMTLNDLKEQIIIQKELEKMLADQTQVSADEIEKYLKDSGVIIPKGQEEGYNNQAKLQLQQQKLTTASQDLISSLKEKAKIRYFVNY